MVRRRRRIRTRERQSRLRSLSFNTLLPNMLTATALIAGLTAVRFAILGRWELAVIAIIVAAVLDGLDGAVARLLKGASEFGAQLDSLADFVSFGIAPALVLYLWVLEEGGRAGWFRRPGLRDLRGAPARAVQCPDRRERPAALRLPLLHRGCRRRPGRAWRCCRWRSSSSSMTG